MADQLAVKGDATPTPTPSPTPGPTPLQEAAWSKPTELAAKTSTPPSTWHDWMQLGLYDIKHKNTRDGIYELGIAESMNPNLLHDPDVQKLINCVAPNANPNVRPPDNLNQIDLCGNESQGQVAAHKKHAAEEFPKVVSTCPQVPSATDQITVQGVLASLPYGSIGNLVGGLFDQNNRGPNIE